jgi:ADP-ribose pyrophosphatase YjhB (NUDIX family)
MTRRALAVCYRLRPEFPGGIEVVVIRTRSGRWTLPGGRVDAGETPGQAAEREAFEEAGVSGRLDPQPVGAVVLIKRPSELLRPAMSHAPVFLLEVLATEDPEETCRRSTPRSASANGACRGIPAPVFARSTPRCARSAETSISELVLHRTLVRWPCGSGTTRSGACCAGARCARY